MRDLIRVLITGYPGTGKTTLMKHLLLRCPLAGVLDDPLGWEFDQAPDKRFPSGQWPGPPKRYRHFRRAPRSHVISAVWDQDPPSVLFADEIHRRLDPSARVQTDEMMDLMDIARNVGLGWVAATKHATLLPPHITTLASVLVMNPPRTPAVQRWLKDAGVAVDLDKELPAGQWIWLPIKGGQEVVSEEIVLSRIAESLTP